MSAEAAIIENEDGLWRLSLWFKDEPTARLVRAFIQTQLAETGFAVVGQGKEDSSHADATHD